MSLKGIPLEKTVQKKLLKKLRELPQTYAFTKEAKSIRGIPDVIACVNGKFIAIEVKRSEKEASKNTDRIVLQKHNINKINKCGGYGFICYPENMEEILQFIKDNCYE
jgi:Holliday junction resolvase